MLILLLCSIYNYIYGKNEKLYSVEYGAKKDFDKPLTQENDQEDAAATRYCTVPSHSGPHQHFFVACRPAQRPTRLQRPKYGSTRTRPSVAEAGNR